MSERDSSNVGYRHVLRALASPLPIAWMTADAACGQEYRFRRMLQDAELGYVPAVPKSQFAAGCPRIDCLFAQAPDEVWVHRSCGQGAKGLRTIVHRIVFAGEPCDESFVDHLVDDILLPLLRAH